MANRVEGCMADVPAYAERAYMLFRPPEFIVTQGEAYGLARRDDVDCKALAICRLYSMKVMA